MDVKQLMYFITVAKMQHFSNAAEELNISQSALSINIKKLSDELGVKLFEKQGRNVRLTQYGEIYLSRIEPAYIQILEAHEAVRLEKTKSAEKVTINGPSMFSFRGLMQKLSQACPGTGIRNLALSIESALNDLKAGKGDIALFMSADGHELEGSGLNYEIFPRDDLSLIINENHALCKNDSVELSQISNETMTCYQKGVNVRPVIDHYFSEEALSANVIYENNSVFDQIALVRNGLAIGIIPRKLLSMHDLAKIQVRSIQPHLDYYICLAWTGKKQRPAVRQTLDIMLEYFRSDDPEHLNNYKTVRETKLS